jgi:hypothetical protein
MSRFNVGQIVVGYRFKVTDSNNNIHYTFTQHNQKDDEKFELELINLECKEHHKVPIDYSESLGDGYLFVDEEDNEFRNQYPIAYYGQVDDSLDRIFINYASKDSKLVMRSYKLINSYAQSILSHIYHIKCEENKSYTSSEYLKARQHFETLRKAYQSFTGNNIRFTLFKYLTEDKEEYIPGFYLMID